MYRGLLTSQMTSAAWQTTVCWERKELSCDERRALLVSMETLWYPMRILLRARATQTTTCGKLKLFVAKLRYGGNE